MLCRLFRLKLALMNGVAALGGCLLFPGNPGAGQLSVIFAGVVLLAGGGSALNQVQERRLDALMLRTRNRPLPTGALQPVGALLLGALALAAGALLLFAAGGMPPMLLGLGIIAWYLAVYTPLKRRTPFALALGAVCGALAPAVGWLSAGGSLGDFRVVLLAGVFYLWQVPHFWLLRQRHADDYRRAGFPVFAPAGGGPGPAPLFRLWVVAMILGALMLPAFGLVGPPLPLWCAVFLAPLLLTFFRGKEPALAASLNLFPLLVSLALYCGR